jgi:hypothetical protein
MTKTTTSPAIKFDIAAAVAIANTFKDTETSVGKAKTALDNATQRRTTAVAMFADTCRAAGFNSMAPLQPKGAYRVEFLDTLAASYLTAKEHKAYASDMATSDRSTGKQVLTAKGQAKNKLTAFVTRLLKAAEPFLSETLEEREAKAKEAAKKGANVNKSKDLETYVTETLQAILKRIGTDARKSEPTSLYHEAISAVIKAAQADAKLALSGKETHRAYLMAHHQGEKKAPRKA